MMSSVAILFSRLGPYHGARIAAASRRFKTCAIEFSRDTSVYAWDQIDSGGLFERITIVPDGAVSSIRRVEFFSRLWTTLNRVRPSVVAIPGWDDPGALAALAWAHWTKTPAIMMSASQRSDRVRSPVRERVKAAVVRTCAAALVGGKAQEDYILDLGIPHEYVFHGYDSVDNGYFESEADRVREHAVAERQRLGLPERYILASSRFVEKKNLPRLLAAYAHYRVDAGSEAVHLVLLGDGPKRAELTELVSSLGLTGFVIMPGFKQYGELPAYYALAELFVLASTHEQWGLVVNEAMAAGIPVLVSKRCGCVPDLVFDWKNGFSFDPTNEKELGELLLRVMSDSSMRTTMGLAGRKIVAGYSPQVFAEKLELARDAALSRHMSPAALDMAIIGTLSLRPR